MTTMDRTDSSSAMMLLQYGMDDSDEDTSFNEQEAAAKPPEKKSPEKRRHTSGKDYDPLSPSRRISEDSVGRQSAGLISDEEVDHHLFERYRKREHEDEEEEEFGQDPAKIRLMEISQKIAPPVSPVDVDSNASPSDSQQSKGQKKSSKPAVMRLVSYGPDDHEEDENESQDESEEESSEEKDEDILLENPSASPGHKGQMIDIDNIQLPPEPPGKCSKMLQDKITDLYSRMKQQGFDTNYEIQRLTSFRNPSIYEKLIQMYHLDEKGSNFKLDVFNPHMWSKDSFYDELDKVQKKDMERREKDRKTAKIEFISGTKKAAPSSDHSALGASDEKKRKSKWDALPAGLPSQMHRSSSGSSMANLTSTATGTRATVISAVGTLTKKASYNIISSSVPFK